VTSPGPRLWLLCMALGPALVAAVAVTVQQDGIENDLSRRSSAALSAAGLSGVGVSFDGRDATLTGVPTGAEARASSIVRELSGVRTAGVGRSGSSPSAVDLALRGGTITVVATVPTDLARRELVDAVRAASPDRAVEDLVTVRPGTGGIDVGRLGALAAALAAGEGDRTLSYGTGITLTGSVPSQQARSAAVAAVRAAAQGEAVDDRLVVAATDARSATAIQARMDALLEAAPIRFDSGSDRLSRRATDTIAKIAALLGRHPQARILVAGHTDNRGSKSMSQPLSDRRAGNVVRELVRLGVDAGRTQAKGYGESRPAASNATPDGRAANRRVEIEVLSGGAS